eukprot:ANDGO_08075.mRNA.1 hypothetical protein
MQSFLLWTPLFATVLLIVGTLVSRYVWKKPSNSSPVTGSATSAKVTKPNTASGVLTASSPPRPTGSRQPLLRTPSADGSDVNDDRSEASSAQIASPNFSHVAAMSVSTSDAALDDDGAGVFPEVVAVAGNSSPGARTRKRSKSQLAASAALESERPEDEDLEELFQLGRAVEEEGEVSLALRCYLACVSSRSGKPFPSVTLCLRRTADLFFRMGEFEKAAKFLNAEKLIYENALLNSQGSSNRAQACIALSKIMASEGYLDMAVRYRQRAEKLGSASATPFDGVNSRDELDLYAARGKLKYMETLRRYNSAKSLPSKKSATATPVQTPSSS